MEIPFNLRLRNKSRAQWLMPVLFITFLVAPYFITTWNYTLNRAGSSFLIIITYLILIAFFILLSSDKAQVSIGDNALIVHYLASDKKLEIPFATVKIHRIVSFKGSAVFTLEKLDGSNLKLATDCQPAQLMRIASKFEDAYYRYKYGHDKLQPIYLGPAFLRRRLASVILVGFAVLLIAVNLIIPDFEGNKIFLLAMGYMSLIIYFLAWISARES